MDRGYVVASGRGTIFSFLVHHAPQCRAGSYRATLALVELDEGVRLVADVRGNPRTSRSATWSWFGTGSTTS